MSSSACDVIVVGAGLAGLRAALDLEAAGRSVRLLEASDGPGGRIRTDVQEGFRLDRGFQVLLTAYPEARRLLDLDALDLRRFYPGALVRRTGRWHRMVDPSRRPWDAWRTLLSSVGRLRDGWKTLALRRRVRRNGDAAPPEVAETTSLSALVDAGFSSEMIDGFFRPWLGGIFLDGELETSSRMLEFVFRMFADGDAAVPARGMGEIPAQLASRLRSGTLETGCRVESIHGGEVRCADGRRLTADAIVVATEGPAAARLLADVPEPASRGVTCMYFAAERDPVGEPILVLDGDRRGPVNNLCVPSTVSGELAPAGAALVSATVLGVPGERGLEDAVRSQLRDWFGADAGRWRHLRTYRIPHALPDQRPPALTPTARPVRLRAGLHVCGDHRDNASIQGALVSGGRAARAVLAEQLAEVR